MNTSWLLVQETEASRELQYHEFKGSDNCTDLFTKVLDHDSILRHTEAMGAELRIGRDPIAITVNLYECRSVSEKLAQEVGIKFKTIGRIQAWT